MSGEIEPTDTAAYQTGRALHTLILEGRSKFDGEYLISSGPTNPKTGEPFGKTTKAYREWLAAQQRPIVSSEDFGWMLKLQQSVALHPVAKRDLLAGIIESVTVYESSVDIKFKAKGDKRLMEEFKHEHNGN